MLKISLQILSAFHELLFGLLNSLIPILWWFWVSVDIEWEAVHKSDMLLSVPSDAGVSILAAHVLVINLILLHNGEQRLITTEAHTS